MSLCWVLASSLHIETKSADERKGGKGKDGPSLMRRENISRMVDSGIERSLQRTASMLVQNWMSSCFKDAEPPRRREVAY